MRLRTFGALELIGSDFTRPKPLLLLAYLATEGPTPRRRLAELFWPDARDGLKSLGVALSQLRGVDPAPVAADDRSARAAVASDVGDLLAALDGSDGGATDPEPLYGGAFLAGVELPGWSAELEEWVWRRRERLAERVRAALLDAAEARARRGDFAAAARLAGRAAELPGAAPLEPVALPRVAALLLAGGDGRAGALLEEARELGVPLEPALARGERAAARRALHRAAAELPAAATPLLGREREVAELEALLESGETRLVTLVGAGGVGKTRLALRVAERLARRSRWEGALHVPLAGVEDGGRMFERIARALPEDARPARLGTAALAAALEATPLLLLDNLEQLRGVAPRLADLLERAPGLAILATSRVRLDLLGERAVPVGGLAVPPPPPGGPREASALRRYGAAALFEARARQVRPGFALGPATADSVARICAGVGGLPLALELAAAWTRALTPVEIAEELERDLALLATTARDAPERHRSLEGLLERSLALVAPAEQRALAALALFEGAFSRTAARAVADVDLATLAALLDASLLERRPLAGGAASAETAAGFALHPLVRRYAAARLGSAARRELEARRAAHYAAALEAGERIPEAETDDALAAWAFLAAALARDERDARATLDRLLHPLFEMLQARARPHDALRAADAGLAAAERAEAVRLAARLRARRGEALARLGRIQEAESLLLGALPELRETADLERAHEALGGLVYYWTGDHLAAERHLERALELARASGGAVARCLYMLGALLWDARFDPRAVELLREARRVARAAGATAWAAYASAGLGRVAIDRGETSSGIGLLREALAAPLPRAMAAVARANLAIGLLAAGDPADLDEAAALLGGAHATFAAISDRGWLSEVSAALAHLEVRRGAPAAARSHAAAALAVGIDFGQAGLALRGLLAALEPGVLPELSAAERRELLAWLAAHPEAYPLERFHARELLAGAGGAPATPPAPRDPLRAARALLERLEAAAPPSERSGAGPSRR